MHHIIPYSIYNEQQCRKSLLVKFYCSNRNRRIYFFSAFAHPRAFILKTFCSWKTDDDRVRCWYNYVLRQMGNVPLMECKKRWRPKRSIYRHRTAHFSALSVVSPLCNEIIARRLVDVANANTALRHLIFISSISLPRGVWFCWVLGVSTTQSQLWLWPFHLRTGCATSNYRIFSQYFTVTLWADTSTQPQTQFGELLCSRTVSRSFRDDW